MKSNSIYFIPLLLLAGCSEMSEPGIGQKKDNGNTEFISTKVTNTSDNSVEGMLMVRTGENGGLDLGSANIPSLSIKSVEQAFPATAGNAERLAKYGLDKWYVIRFDKGTSLQAAAKSLSESPAIEKIQFNKKLKLNDGGRAIPYSAGELPPFIDADFNDPMLVDQWHYINRGSTSLTATVREGADVNLKNAWRLTAGDPSVVVAILDQGVQYTHPDLAENMWVNEKELNGSAGADDDGNLFVDDIYGYNFVSDGPITWAKEGDNGHGTHVAGTVAAVNNNGVGVCGIAGGTGNNDGVRIMSCQVFDGEYGGDALSVARACIYAAENGAAIIQCSFSYNPGTFSNDEEYQYYSPIEAYAIDYFMEYGGGDVLDGGLAIFASGNDASSASCYPGAYTECISVTAIGPDYLPASYTNYGPGCNIAAPGGETSLNAEGRTGVLSTMPSDVMQDGSEYAFMQGTSMACPHVSGVAALGLSYAKKLGIKMTREEFTSILLTSVNDLEGQLDREKAGMNLYEYHGMMGTGLVDAWKLLMRIEGTPSILAPVGKEAYLDLSSCLGGSSASLDTYVLVNVKFDADAIAALGIEGVPSVENGKLKIKCTKTGCAKCTVTMYVDYKAYMGEQGPEAGDIKTVTREISIISRGAAASNGGWL